MFLKIRVVAVAMVTETKEEKKPTAYNVKYVGFITKDKTSNIRKAVKSTDGVKAVLEVKSFTMSINVDKGIEKMNADTIRDSVVKALNNRYGVSTFSTETVMYSNES